ncbi:MAG TPA: PilZ domain-containing protein [Polyangiaceae bacterium]|nr:PilZ domain-containing protein [Polyangiaceae bacterium]
MRPVLHADCARARLRRAVSTPCEVVRERDFKLVGTRVLDLSTKGMLLETDLSVLTGEDLVVSFKSPSSERWYDCEATIARVLHGRRRVDAKRAVGISFVSLHLLDELLLCEELRHAPVTGRHLAASAMLGSLPRTRLS